MQTCNDVVLKYNIPTSNALTLHDEYFVKYIEYALSVHYSLFCVCVYVKIKFYELCSV